MVTAFQPIQFCFANFWNVLIQQTPTQPAYTDLIRLTEATLLCEEEIDKKKLLKLNELESGKNQRIRLSISALELLYLIQMRRGSPINKEIEIEGQTYKLYELYEHLEYLTAEMVRIMMQIAKQYSLEIPIQSLQTNTKTSIL